MYRSLREGYGRLRRRRVVGAFASRVVWAVKGLLGRPVTAPALPPAPVRHPTSAPPIDPRLQVALAAVQALSERIAALEPPSAASPVDAMASRTTPSRGPATVSVIVSTLDRATWLDRALTALAYQRHPAFEVIVVAGPCRDGTDEVLARHAARVRRADCPIANLSASRNAGLRLAAGEIVAFLDDDSAPEPDWLERLCAPFADAAVGGVGGYIRDATGVGFQCRVVVADRFGASADVESLGRARLDPPGPGVDRYLSLTGTNSAFRRSALVGVGGFDEAYTYFLDETDVCLRLVEAGWRLTVVPEAEVHHGYAPSAQRRADRAPLSLIAPVRSTAYFAMRHASGRHGFAATAGRLGAYAEGLRRDIAWRSDHGVTAPSQADRLLGEIEAGLEAGVKAALAAPRRNLRLDATAPADARVRGAPVLRPAEERLRLCLLSQDYPGKDDAASPPGGVAIWTRALAEAMAARGHEVSVLARARNGAASVSLQAEDGVGVWLHRVMSEQPPPLRRGVLAGVPASVSGPALAAAREVARIAPRRRFDLVMGPLWDLEPAALVDAGPWATAVSLHTACAQMTAYKPEWSLEHRRTHVDRIIAAERRLLARAAHVLSNSAAAAHDIEAALDLPGLSARAAVIAHGLPDLAHGVRAAERGAGVDILFVGRLEPRKGVDVLLDAATRLLADVPEARLTLVGEDVSPPGAPRWAETFLDRHAGAPWIDRVRFTGPLARAELLASYAACDLVVSPSRYESFGLTALEAMIFGKPCVAAAAGGLSEVVLDGVTGLLVPPGDAPALAAALRRLTTSSDLRRRMGAAGRRRYEALFTAERMAQAYEAWARGIAVAPRQLAAE